MFKICFTGHRPSKLGGYDWNTQKNQKIMKKLRDTIINVVSNSGETDVMFYCGGALGIDQMAFNICKDLKSTDHNRNYTIVLAIPFKKQDCRWPILSQEEFTSEEMFADVVTFVDMIPEYEITGYKEGEYYPAKMEKRNEYMVDHSDIVIAVWDGSKSGTGNCIKYAQKLNKRIIRIDPNNL